MRYFDLVLLSEQLLPGVFNRAVLDAYEIDQYKETDMIGMKTKIISARVTSRDDMNYNVVVQINRVDCGCTEERDVLVRCTCPAFRFWFAEANRRHHVLYGMHFKQYVPVPSHLLTRPRRAPLNPGNVPGVCKHIILLMKSLQREGVVSRGGDYDVGKLI